MPSGKCLNCGVQTAGKYCSNCGQKTQTHRISFRHFLAHDLLHGTFHPERGILFTLKEAIVRPGQAALDYIAGKRVRYYNVFYLSLLLMALNAFVWHWTKSGSDTATPENSELVELIGHYLKALVLCLVPLLALNGKILFGRLKLNFTEHCILGGISLVGMLLMAVLFQFSDLIERHIPSLSMVKVLVFIAMVTFPIWTYRNAMGNRYKFLDFSWRTAAFMALLSIEVMMIIVVLSLVFANSSSLEINL